MDAHPTELELLARARGLAPALRARAQACEDLRRVPDETMREFKEAGFFRILQPAKYGGYEMHPMAAFRVAIELAKACPSSAWVENLLSVHNWELGLLDPQAAADVWKDDTSILLSSSYAPFGQVETVDGGFRISGRWPWSSGCDHGQYAILGGVARGPNGPDPRAFIVARDDYAIDDTWHVLGLQGTGSKDIVVENAFVPDYRTHSYMLAFMRQERGRDTFTAKTYRFPFGVVFAYCLSVVTIGMAEGALECFNADMKERLGAYDGAKALDDPFIRQRLAHADAITRGLRSRLEANFAAMDRYVDAGEEIPLDIRVQNKWDAQAIAREAMEAVTLLFKASGGRGIRREHPIQRFFRDIHAASNHAFLNAEKGALNAGGVLLGQALAQDALRHGRCAISRALQARKVSRRGVRMRQQHAPHGGNETERADPVCLDGAQDCCGVERALHDQGNAGDGCGDGELRAGEVKHRQDAEDRSLLAGLLPRQPSRHKRGDETCVGEHDAFGMPRRAACIEDAGHVLAAAAKILDGAPASAQALVACCALRPRGLADEHDARGRPVDVERPERRREAVVHDDRRRCAVLQREGDLRGGPARIERDCSGGKSPASEQDLDVSIAVEREDRDPIASRNAKIAQAPGQFTRGGVQRSPGRTARAEADSFVSPRVTRGAFYELREMNSAHGKLQRLFRSGRRVRRHRRWRQPGPSAQASWIRAVRD